MGTTMVKEALKSLALRSGGYYCTAVNKREFKRQQFQDLNERTIEYGFLFNALQHTWPVTILDVGTGTTALPAVLRTCGFLITAVDNISGYWPKGMINRHYHIVQDDITNTNLKDQFEFITCISVLEHITDYIAAVQSMFRLLRQGGHLLLTFPYNETRYIENVYKLPEAGYGQDFPFICQVFSRNEIENLMSSNGAFIVEQEYWEVFSGDLWTFGKRLNPPRRVGKNDKHHLTCILCSHGDEKESQFEDEV